MPVGQMLRREESDEARKSVPRFGRLAIRFGTVITPSRPGLWVSSSSTLEVARYRSIHPSKLDN